MTTPLFSSCERNRKRRQHLALAHACTLAIRHHYPARTVHTIDTPPLVVARDAFLTL